MMALRVAGYVKLAKLWEKNRINALNLHQQYFAEIFEDDPTHELVGVYVDITGNKNIRQRSEMIRLLHDCCHRRVDIVYTQTKAYLAANTREFFYLLKFLFDLDNRIDIVTEDTDYNIDTIRDAENQTAELKNLVNRYSALNPGDYERWKAEILAAISAKQGGHS